MTTSVDLPAASKLDLSEIQSAVSRGEMTITVPAGTHNADLPAIASCIKGAKGITLDLSATKITAIGERAFASCSALKTVILPSTLTSIGDYAFLMCDSLISITIPSSVTSIGDEAFSGCENLSSVTIDVSVTSIGAGAFEWCENLTSITIGAGVTSIGEWVFYRCKRLTSIMFAHTEGWCLDEGLTQSVGSWELSSRVKAGAALYNNGR